MEPYKQNFTQSCLVADLLMLTKKSEQLSNKEVERDILIKGMDRKYSFYVVGIIEEFYNKSKEKTKMFVDNLYFTKVLSKLIDKNKCEVAHNKISLKLIRENLPCIVYIDDNYFGDYSHAPHFVIIKDKTDSGFRDIDPMSGKEEFISEKKLIQSIDSLKKHIKMCPLLIKMEEN